jgi:hypothetical protein
MIDIGYINMVGYGKCGISGCFCTSNQLKRNQFTVAKNTMRMEINHLKKIQEDAEKCKV